MLYADGKFAEKRITRIIKKNRQNLYAKQTEYTSKWSPLNEFNLTQSNKIFLSNEMEDMKLQENMENKTKPIIHTC